MNTTTHLQKVTLLHTNPVCLKNYRIVGYKTDNVCVLEPLTVSFAPYKNGAKLIWMSVDEIKNMIIATK
jgi:hypothetical protein